MSDVPSPRDLSAAMCNGILGRLEAKGARDVDYSAPCCRHKVGFARLRSEPELDTYHDISVFLNIPHVLSQASQRAEPQLPSRTSRGRPIC